MNSFVKNLPRLKSLTTETVNQQIFDTITENSTVLESINVDFFTAKSPPSTNKLQSLKNMSITMKSDDNFREQIEKKEQRTNFDEVFLSASKRLNRKWNINNKSFYKCWPSGNMMIILKNLKILNCSYVNKNKWFPSLS